ncbi:hypothetical protein Adt_25557 [Abeliophyllum distichum]|uniref:Seed maturation-like protein n=1 Tax=Abeliophyllum distichum TaxID=126358 RepID=A0ABD1SH08_9LAMI
MAGSAIVPAKAFLISRVTELSLIRPLLPATSFTRKRQPCLSSSAVVSCLISGVDGGGVSDEFLPTSKSASGREFTVIANMLKRIEPLDTSIFTYGISDPAKDSMKQTISAMLGVLPSAQFSVTVRITKRPLDRLIVSSIITGYTLWNAEYRISLMRNFDISPDSSKRSDFSEYDGGSEVKLQESEGSGGNSEGYVEELERINLQILRDLSPEASNYIRQLESELSAVKKELHFQKQENLHTGYITKSNKDPLQYLRSLESDMVTELSRPSSSEVEKIIHQLAENILRRFFKDQIAYDYEVDSAMRTNQNYQSANEEFCGIISMSRDYLAKLLFWCMLLGHHLRGLENRLHLSSVGLL